MAGIERRKNPRRRPDRLAYVKIQPDNGGALADVSETGIGFQVVAGVIQDNSVNLWMQLDSLGPIEAVGEVVWLDETRRVGGIQFTQLSNDAREKLRSWVAQANAGKNVVVELRSSPSPAQSPAQEIPAAKAVGGGFAISELQDDEPEVATTSNGGGTVPAAERVAAAAPSITAQNPEPPATPAYAPPPNSYAPPPVAPAYAPPPPLRPARSPVPPAAPVQTAAPATNPAHIAGPPVMVPPVRKDPAPFRRTSQRVSPKVERPYSQPRDFVAPRPGEWDDLRNSMTRTPRMSSSILLTGLPAEPAPSSRRPMIAACVAFGIMVLGMGYWLMSSYRGELGDTLIAMGEKLTGSSTPAPEQRTDATAPGDAAASETAPANESTPAARAAISPNPNSPVRSANSGVPGSATASLGSAAPPVGGTGDTGAMEFGVAKQFLVGTNGRSQPIQAVEWLWIAVEKGNTPAEVALADLYIRGEGVAQSCEEGRVLLIAASKKGSVEATRALADLPARGCQAGATSGANDPSGARTSDPSDAAPPRRPLTPPSGTPASTPSAIPATPSTSSSPSSSPSGE
jgi:PilZ domain-containing protein